MITIDGPAGAGKSTVAKMLAQKLGFYLLDTGAIYRCLALFAKRHGVSYDDPEGLTELAAHLPIEFLYLPVVNRIFLEGEDVTQKIRDPEVSEGASQVSPYESVRAALLPLQRQLARKGSCIVEGRDTGTVVLPDAPLKFFLTARPEIRAQRRLAELQAIGTVVEYEQILKEQTIRDQRDAGRVVAPLKQPPDAIVLDTSDLKLEQVVDCMERMYRERIKEKA